MLHRLAIASSLLATLAAAPADARRVDGTARLRHCGTATCVVLTGVRAGRADVVTVAGHPVAVQGARRFEAEVPVDTIRDWSAPFARTVALATVGRDGEIATREVRLPIGLLGHVTELASLEVRSR